MDGPGSVGTGGGVEGERRDPLEGQPGRYEKESAEMSRMDQIKLDLNRHKGGFEDCPLDFLFAKMEEELTEFYKEVLLLERFPERGDKSRATLEGADVRNVVTGILVRVGAL